MDVCFVSSFLGARARPSRGARQGQTRSGNVTTMVALEANKTDPSLATYYGRGNPVFGRVVTAMVSVASCFFVCDSRLPACSLCFLKF